MLLCFATFVIVRTVSHHPPCIKNEKFPWAFHNVSFLQCTYWLCSPLNRLCSNWDEPRERRNLEPSQNFHLLFTSRCMNAIADFLHLLKSSPKILFFAPWYLYIWTWHYVLIVLLITIPLKYNSRDFLRHRFLLWAMGQFGIEACGCSKKAHHLSK